MSRIFVHKTPKDFEPCNNVIIGKNDYYMQLAEEVYVAVKKRPRLLHRLFLRAFFGFKTISHNMIFGGEE